MNCSCDKKLYRYIRDSLMPGETSTNCVVRVADKTLPGTEEAFKHEGFWAASISDAEWHTAGYKGRQSPGPVHDIVHPSGVPIHSGTHTPIAA